MSITFSADLARRLQFGDILSYEGTLNGNTVELNHVAANGDYLLHISCKMGEEIAVMTRINDKYDNKVHVKWQSLKKGEPFSVTIFVNVDYFHIYFNSKEVTVYPYKAEVNKIVRLEFIAVSDVKCFNHRATVPNFWPVNQVTPSFSNDIPIRFKTGHVVAITATATGDENGEFCLLFRDAVGLIVIFQMRASFKTKLVYRNCQGIDGKWLEDETDGDFPFTIGKEFEIAIGMSRANFLIAINRKRFANFAHKKPWDIFETLQGFFLFGQSGVKVQVKKIQHSFIEPKECLDYDVAKYSIIKSKSARSKCRDRKLTSNKTTRGEITSQSSKHRPRFSLLRDSATIHKSRKHVK